MATVIGVGMQMTANAAGMTKGLSDADRALQLLQKIVEQNQQSLQRFGAEATKTATSLEKLTRDTGTLSKIEIGRVLVDSFQAIGGAFTSAARNVLTLAGNVSQSLDSFNDLSARTGIGVEQLQGYSLAAKLAGVDTAEFGSAVQKLSVNIGKATPGGELDKSLRAINLSVAELRALSPEQQFSLIGDAIGRLPTAADRAAASVAVFGKQGAALAPLFREGAASLEELRARAERLGIIVNEEQLANIGQMNDGFDLVRATVEGIIGQVIGNFAPAVTDITNQFLKFIETFEGTSTQGKGGRGIANAITDVLLRGAEIFAKVFDSFVGKFSGFTVSLETTAAIFQAVANGFTAVTESLRQVFNLFELIGNGIMLAIGKLLEEVGAWVSDDLAQAGAEIAKGASDELAKNQREFLEAGSNSFKAGLDAIGLGEGTSSAAARGSDAAQAYVQKFAAEVEASRQPEVKVADNIADTRERLLAFLADAGEGADEFFQQSVETLEVFKAQVEQGSLTAEQIKIMNGFSEQLNGRLTKENNLRKELADAAKAQSEADDKRIESLLKTSDAASKLQDDLDIVERKIEEVRASNDADSQARLGQLQALRAQLQDQQQALNQGFGEGFQKAFEGTDKVLDDAMKKAAEFGLNGIGAAQELADGIKAAQDQVEGGFFTRDDYEAEVARQRQFFDERLKLEQKAAEDRKKQEEEATRLRLQQEQVVNDLIKAQEFNGDADRIRAAENLVAINEEIARAEQAVIAARENNDAQALAAANVRLEKLGQVKAREEDIANGQAKQRELFQQAFLQQQEESAKRTQQIQQAQLQEQARIAEERRKAEEAEYNRQVARITELNTLGSRTVSTADIRTQEGQALLLGLAANAQDPALIEARTQTKQLQLIAQGIAQAAANYFNSPVAIVGGAQLG